MERGSILVHVLVMSVIMSIVAAGMVGVTMMQYRVTAQVEQQTHARRLDEVALARMLSAWNFTNPGTPCQNIPSEASGAPLYSCAGSGCNCNCTTTDANLPTIVMSDGGGICTATITSSALSSY